MADGVLVASDTRGTWAWVGVRIDAAADLTETREYADLPEHERLVKAVAADTAWLAGQWDTGYGARVELRYLSDPVQHRLACAVLGRVHGGEPGAVTSAALGVRARIAGLPRHVHAVESDDPGEVGRWLVPFQPHPHGLADIAKRIRAPVPNRPDAGVPCNLPGGPATGPPPSG